MRSQFIVRNPDADGSSETQGLVNKKTRLVGELLCTARAWTKRLDETKWSETRDVSRPRCRYQDHIAVSTSTRVAK